MLIYLIFLVLMFQLSLENFCIVLGEGVESSESFLIYIQIKSLEFRTKMLDYLCPLVLPL